MAKGDSLAELLKATPLLGPGSEAFKELVVQPRALLLEACARRGIHLGARAPRATLADALVRDSIRARAEAHYTENERCFLSIDNENSFVRALLVRRQYRSILEIGCGSGLMAESMRPVLRPEARWFGFDIIHAAVNNARRRLADDDRFTFALGDGESLPAPRDIDCAFAAWCIPWMNTHGVFRMMQHLSRGAPTAELVCTVPFLSCVRQDATPTPEEIEAAEAYLNGKPSQAAAMWDLRRFELARNAVERFYSLVETHVIPTASVVWVARRRDVPQR